MVVDFLKHHFPTKQWPWNFQKKNFPPNNGHELKKKTFQAKNSHCLKKIQPNNGSKFFENKFSNFH